MFYRIRDRPLSLGSIFLFPIKYCCYLFSVSVTPTPFPIRFSCTTVGFLISLFSVCWSGSGWENCRSVSKESDGFELFFVANIGFSITIGSCCWDSEWEWWWILKVVDQRKYKRDFFFRASFSLFYFELHRPCKSLPWRRFYSNCPNRQIVAHRSIL